MFMQKQIKQKPLFVDPTRITLDQRASAQASLDKLKPGSLTKSQIGASVALTSLMVTGAFYSIE